MKPFDPQCRLEFRTGDTRIEVYHLIKGEGVTVVGAKSHDLFVISGTIHVVLGSIEKDYAPPSTIRFPDGGDYRFSADSDYAIAVVASGCG